MNKRIQNLFMKYDELEREYPNIINLNRSILEFHINKIDESLKKCEDALVEIKKRDKDFTKDELISIYLFNTICR
tara:strand:- start:14898 stop:15122 length:225 start_codon:yes stop_codon:yes gene_type:complete